MGDKNLVAYCGLYCGSCKKYKKGKCPGCHENEKASWCKIRTCCIENGYASCVDCSDFSNPDNCKKFNNFISKVISFIFKSDRKSSLKSIKENGYKNYADAMEEKGDMCLKK